MGLRVPDQRNLARPVVPVVLEAEADQSVAPVIVMPAAPRTARSGRHHEA